MATLWLPEQAKRDDRTFKCRLCQTPLRPQEATRHVRECYRANEAEIRSQSLREKAPALFGDEGIDTEFLSYHRRRAS